jgi:hypothetical protein
MKFDITVEEARTTSFFFKRQVWHLLSAPLLAWISFSLAEQALGDGSWLGLRDSTWFWLAIILVILHQLGVWLVFRSQLGWALLTRLFGKADLVVWAIFFVPLLIARPVVLFALALSDQSSSALPRSAGVIIGIFLLIPTFYTLWSVGHYFGLARALGGDHFRMKYREMPMVREGAFRWSDNAMYGFAFLGLWALAFITGSQAALSLALFQHVFIWLHYFCTEKPDMDLIYG